MLTLDIPQAQIRQLQNLLGKDVPKKLKREIVIAVNATAKKTRTGVNKQVRQELAVTSRAVNQVLKIKRANNVKFNAQVILEKERRLSLKEFKPRQTRRGTSYTVSRKSGRKTVAGAFMGPRPGAVATRLGGHVFKRASDAKRPIHKLHGASPWGAYKKNRLNIPTVRDGRRELTKQLEKRIRFQRLKKSGTI